MKRTSRQDRRLCRVRVHDVRSQPHGIGESDTLGTPRENRLGSDVEGQIPDRLESQLAAQAICALEHHRVDPTFVEETSSGQPGDATADDRSAHSGGARVDEVDQSGERVGIRLRKNPMAEVEDVPPCRLAGLDDRRRLLVNDLGRREQQRGVEIALQ